MVSSVITAKLAYITKLLRVTLSMEMNTRRQQEPLKFLNLHEKDWNCNQIETRKHEVPSSIDETRELCLIWKEETRDTNSQTREQIEVRLSSHLYCYYCFLLVLLFTFSLVL